MGESQVKEWLSIDLSCSNNSFQRLYSLIQDFFNQIRLVMRVRTKNIVNLIQNISSRNLKLQYYYDLELSWGT